MTRFNNKYPYTDFHELNADWLLETVKDAEAEAKEAAETVETYNDRLTTVEGDLAPIKAAMPGLASDVSGLQHDVGIMDSLITNTINPGLETLQTEVETASTGLLDRMTAAEGDIDTLQNEVETPTTGLLDRVTALENQPVPSANAVYYLEFDSSLVSIDPDNAYDSRIEYDWLKQFVPLNVSGEDTHVIKLYDSHTQKVYDLATFHLQESVSPDGKFIFTNRAEHTTGGVIDYYVNSTVTVLQNGTNPTFAEENETVLPAVTSGDAGDVLTVDNNGDWVAATPSLPNAFDVFWNSTGTSVGSQTANISTPSTTVSIPLSGQMNFTVTFKGILEIVAQTGSVCYAKYLLYKRAGGSAVYASKLYEFGGVISDLTLSLTGGYNPGTPATALNVLLTVNSGMNANVTLYSV